jgi:hypothetical protein
MILNKTGVIRDKKEGFQANASAGILHLPSAYITFLLA